MRLKLRGWLLAARRPRESESGIVCSLVCLGASIVEARSVQDGELIAGQRGTCSGVVGSEYAASCEWCRVFVSGSRPGETVFANVAMEETMLQ